MLSLHTPGRQHSPQRKRFLHLLLIRAQHSAGLQCSHRGDMARPPSSILRALTQRRKNLLLSVFFPTFHSTSSNNMVNSTQPNPLDWTPLHLDFLKGRAINSMGSEVRLLNLGPPLYSCLSEDPSPSVSPRVKER